MLCQLIQELPTGAQHADLACDVVAALKTIEPDLFTILEPDGFATSNYLSGHRILGVRVAGCGTISNAEHERAQQLLRKHFCVDDSDPASQLCYPPPVATDHLRFRYTEGEPQYGQAHNTALQALGAAPDSSEVVDELAALLARAHRARKSDKLPSWTEHDVLLILLTLPEKFELFSPVASQRLVSAGADAIRVAVSRLRQKAFPGQSMHWIHDLQSDRALGIAFTLLRCSAGIEEGQRRRSAAAGFNPNAGVIDLSLVKDLPAEDLDAMFASISFDRQRVTTLNVRGSRLVTSKLLGTHCENFKMIKTLNLSNCPNLTDEGLHFIAPNLPFLTDLDISRCALVSDLGIIVIAKKCNILTSLDVSNCNKVTDSGVAAVGKFCEDLTRLSVKSCVQVSDTGIKALARSPVFCKHLKRLDLSRCRRLTDATLGVIGDSFTALTRLSLDNCYHITAPAIQVVTHRCVFFVIAGLKLAHFDLILTILCVWMVCLQAVADEAALCAWL